MGKYGFGVDLGGTTAKIGFFSLDGTLLEKWEILTDTSSNGQRILPNISASISEFVKGKQIDAKEVVGVGIGVPGPVTNKSLVSRCVNLGWSNKDVAKELTQLSGFSVLVGNDANIAALGEMNYGAAKGCKNGIVITLGTGVGGGVIVDGNMLEGASGAGGEIGHFVVNPNEMEKCNCGQHGCLEQYVSATGIVRMARERILTSCEETILIDDETLSAKKVFDAAKKGDILAISIINDMGSILGKTLANISAVINPEIIVIGGGVSRAGELLLDTVSRYFYEDCFFPCHDTQIRLARLGNDAGIYGGLSLIKNMSIK